MVGAGTLGPMDFPPPDDKSVVAPYLGLSAAK
jgi:hypothetical protein